MPPIFSTVIMSSFRGVEGEWEKLPQRCPPGQAGCSSSSSREGATDSTPASTTSRGRSPTGLSAEGPIRGPFRYRFELDGFLLPGLRGGDRAAEGLLAGEWRPSARFRLAAGARFSWLALPQGTRFLWPPFPVLDVAWAWDLGRWPRGG